MTLSTVERRHLDQIEISLLAHDPALATRLDMVAVQRRLARRELAVRRGRRWGLLVGLIGVAGVQALRRPQFSVRSSSRASMVP